MKIDININDETMKKAAAWVAVVAVIVGVIWLAQNVNQKYWYGRKCTPSFNRVEMDEGLNKRQYVRCEEGKDMGALQEACDRVRWAMKSECSKLIKKYNYADHTRERTTSAANVHR